MGGYSRYRPDDPWQTDQRTGFRERASRLKAEDMTDLLVVDPDPQHPSEDIPPIIGVEVVEDPTGPPQDVFIQEYGVVVGVNG